MKNKDRGSITLEASIVVPIFIILMLAVNGLFIMFSGQQMISHALIQSAKSLAFDPYATQRIAGDEDDKLADMFQDIYTFAAGAENYVSHDKWFEDSENIDSLVESRFIAYLRSSKSDANELLKTIGVKDGVDGLNFSGCSVDDGILTIKVRYTQEFIFNAADLASFERELSVKVRLFEYKY